MACSTIQVGVMKDGLSLSGTLLAVAFRSCFDCRSGAFVTRIALDLKLLLVSIPLLSNIQISCSISKSTNAVHAFPPNIIAEFSFWPPSNSALENHPYLTSFTSSLLPHPSVPHHPSFSVQHPFPKPPFPPSS